LGVQFECKLHQKHHRYWWPHPPNLHYVPTESKEADKCKKNIGNHHQKAQSKIDGVHTRFIYEAIGLHIGTDQNGQQQIRSFFLGGNNGGSTYPQSQPIYRCSSIGPTEYIWQIFEESHIHEGVVWVRCGRGRDAASSPRFPGWVMKLLVPSIKHICNSSDDWSIYFIIWSVLPSYGQVNCG
jgi:hypothetical protein